MRRWASRFRRQLAVYPAGEHDDALDGTSLSRFRISNRGIVSHWISQNYWKGGWRSWLCGVLNSIGNRWPGLLP